MKHYALFSVCLGAALAALTPVECRAQAIPLSASGERESMKAPAETSPSPTPLPPAEAKEKAEKDEASAIEQVEITKKELLLEKRKAAVELKEAELAKKEAALSRETARSAEEIKAALERERKEVMEAISAQEKVRIAMERMRAAEEKARLAAEEVRTSREQAALAEKKLEKRRSTVMHRVYVTLAILIAGYLFLSIILSLIARGVRELKVRHILRKTVIYIVNILLFVYIFFLWVERLNTITIFLGVAGAGIALALQEVILCIAGWFLILARRPFMLGDRVEFGGVKGDVIDFRLFQTVLLEISDRDEGEQSTGRIVNVPNSMIFKKECYNYSRGFEYIWNEIRVLVTFESDWKRAEEIMREHAAAYCEGVERLVRRRLSKMTKRYMIFYEHLTPIVYVNISGSGVELTLRYITEARSRRLTQDALSRRILDSFEKEPRVNFAYTTYRIIK